MLKMAHVIMMALTFSSGLLVGLLFHLPVVSSPDSPRIVREIRKDLDPVPAPDRFHRSPGKLSAIVAGSQLSDNIDLEIRTGVNRHEAAQSSSGHDDQKGTLTDHRHRRLKGFEGSLNTQKQSTKSDQATIQAKDSSVSHNQRTNPEDRNDKPTMAHGKSSDFVASGNELFHSLNDIVQGICWSSKMEELTPKGFTSNTLQDWRNQLQISHVKGMSEGCGRMQNRLLTLQDGTKACARYRINNDQILGDILSYYLSQLLEIHHVPPSVLVLADPRNATWRPVAGELAAAQWHHERPLVLVPWIDDLKPAYIPKEMRGLDGYLRKLHPTKHVLSNRTVEELQELVQWSDLIVYDYLTANLDRVVNNMFNHQWNAAMMDSPTHNLEVVPSTGLLVFLDNEAGLLHSYRLLDKYAHFHRELLSALCVFRPQTAALVKHFHSSDSIGQALRRLYESREPLHELLPRLPSRNIKILHTRLKDVYDQIMHCEHIYGR